MPFRVTEFGLMFMFRSVLSFLFPCNELLQVDDNFWVSSSLQVLSGFGVFSGEKEQFGEELRRLNKGD